MSGPVSEYGENGFSHLQAARVTGWRLTLRQFMAIFLKRFHHVRRSKKGFLVEVRKTLKGIYFYSIFFFQEHYQSVK